MKTALNTSIEQELMFAVEEYMSENGDKKSAVITAALLKAIPREILLKHKVKGIL